MPFATTKSVPLRFLPALRVAAGDVPRKSPAPSSSCAPTPLLSSPAPSSLSMEVIPLPDKWKIWALIGVLFSGARALHAQADWPVYGHDPGGMSYSPLKQLDSKNVSKLALAWTYDTEAVVQTQTEPSPHLHHAFGHRRRYVHVHRVQPRRRA